MDDFEKMVSKLAQNEASRILGPVDMNNSSLKARKQKIKKCIEYSIKAGLERTEDCLHDFLEQHIEDDKLQQNVTFIEEHLTAACRQLRVQMRETDSSADELRHVKAIKRHTPALVRELRLTGTTFLDELVVQKAMSDTERKSIVAKATDERQNKAFIECLCTNFTQSSFRSIVIPLLKKDQTHVSLGQRLETELDTMSTSNKETCCHCKMKEFVNLGTLSKTLVEMNAIPVPLWRNLREESIPWSSKWSELLKFVKKKKILEALKVCHPYLYTVFTSSGQTLLTCCCSSLCDESSGQIHIRETRFPQFSNSRADNLNTLRPVSSLAHDGVSFASSVDLSTIRSASSLSVDCDDNRSVSSMIKRLPVSDEVRPLKFKIKSPINTDQDRMYASSLSVDCDHNRSFSSMIKRLPVSDEVRPLKFKIKSPINTDQDRMYASSLSVDCDHNRSFSSMIKRLPVSDEVRPIKFKMKSPINTDQVRMYASSLSVDCDDNSSDSSINTPYQVSGEARSLKFKIKSPINTDQDRIRSFQLKRKKTQPLKPKQDRVPSVKKKKKKTSTQAQPGSNVFYNLKYGWGFS